MLTPHSVFRPRRFLRARAGYTLVELAIVMMVGGVVSSISIGKVHALLSQQRVMHAATAIQNDLEAAFQIAGRNRKPVRIVWTPSTQQFSVADRTGSMFYRKTSLSQQAYGFTASSITCSTWSLDVYPNGFAADTMLITLNLNGVTKKLRMSRTGLVQVR